MTREQKAGAFILAGIAAYGIFRLAKMNASDRAAMTDKLKTKGKELLSQVKPSLFKKSSSVNNVMEASSI